MASSDWLRISQLLGVGRLMGHGKHTVWFRVLIEERDGGHKQRGVQGREDMANIYTPLVGAVATMQQ
jgi:hypothetical protein